MPLQVIGDRRFPSRVLLLLLFLLLSGLFAVTVATYGVERELYLPVESFHPLFVPWNRFIDYLELNYYICNNIKSNNI